VTSEALVEVAAALAWAAPVLAEAGSARDPATARPSAVVAISLTILARFIS
jgi:hypothetical protein